MTMEAGAQPRLYCPSVRRALRTRLRSTTANQIFDTLRDIAGLS